MEGNRGQFIYAPCTRLQTGATLKIIDSISSVLKLKKRLRSVLLNIRLVIR